MLGRQGIILIVVLGFTKGNHFPPVQNTVPIPAPAVKAPLGIFANGVYLGSHDAYIPNTGRTSQESDQRQYVDSSIGYIPPTSPPDFSEDDAFEEKIYENGLPAVGPVATPPPDESNEGTPNDPSMMPLVPRVHPPTHFRMVDKYPFNQYTINRWLPMEPEGVGVSSAHGSKEAVDLPKRYPSLQELIQNLPTVQNYNRKPQPLIPVFSSEFSDSELSGRSSVASGLPIDSSNGNSPLLPSIVTEDLGVSLGNRWIANPQVRQVLIPTLSQAAIVGPENVRAEEVDSVEYAKSNLPINIPIGFAVSNSWALRQHGKEPYVEHLRTLLPHIPQHYPKGISPLVPTYQDKNTPVVFPGEMQSMDPMGFGALLYRRGNEVSKPLTTAVIDTLPHSAKSDEIEDGILKGHPLQKYDFLQPLLDKELQAEACFETMGDSAAVFPVSPKTIQLTRKGRPGYATTMQQRKPFAYVIRNPATASDIKAQQKPQFKAPFLPTTSVTELSEKYPVMYVLNNRRISSSGKSTGIVVYPEIISSLPDTINQHSGTSSEFISYSRRGSEEGELGGEEEFSSKLSSEETAEAEKAVTTAESLELVESSQLSDADGTVSNMDNVQTKKLNPHVVEQDDRDRHGALLYKHSSTRTTKQ